MNQCWRIIDTGARSGAYNMRYDTALAERLVHAGPYVKETAPLPVLRLYRWKPWAISLGYNQDASEIDRDRCIKEGIDVVRRPTGGRAILHAEELTYSIVMYAGRKSVLQVYNDISRGLVRGLRLYGVDVALHRSQPNFAEEYRHLSSIPCFTSSARYEIEWEGRKLVGSAQRRFSDGERDVVLQHGAILCGPVHQRLAEYLILPDEKIRDQLRRELLQKTIDLAALSGVPVRYNDLAACLRKGFAEEWGAEFIDEEMSPMLQENNA
jgi:lipoate-protein ligase A